MGGEKKQADAREVIRPGATILDVVHVFRSTEPVFRALDEQAGECVLCKALFLTLEQAAEQYGLDLDQLLGDLLRAASE